MQEELKQDLTEIFKIFDGMRTKIRKSEKYTEKIAAINKFHEALSVFSHQILPDHVPPFLKVKKDEDDWLDCRS